MAVRGWGVVSPAGWGVAPFREALAGGRALPHSTVDSPGGPLPVRRVPPFPGRSPVLTHPRLRRASAITQFAAAAALEALDAAAAGPGGLPARLGIILCTTTGCVNYSRRFFGEVLNDPGTASPLLFPETVFNAPASHIAALIGSSGITHTWVGDQGMFIQGLAQAAAWLRDGQVEGCVVIGAEEIDWLSADAFQKFERKILRSEGAGAVYLTRATKTPNHPEIMLQTITSMHRFPLRSSRETAASAMRSELPAGQPSDLLCLGVIPDRRSDRAERDVWSDWPGQVMTPKSTLGEGLAASPGWQCAAALEQLRAGACRRAIISVVGFHQQAIGVCLGTR